MSEALATVPVGDTGLNRDRIGWTEDQVALIKRTVAKDCTADEFKLFLYQCARTGLDPLAKQIYAIRRAGRMTIQTAIDGFRLAADRTRKYAGQDDATFSGTPGKTDFTATVTVYKLVGNTRCPFTATARWSEYYPGDAQGTMWKKMPHTMLAKCAEALALRKAFPADLSGLYTAEEMDQADAGQTVTTAAVFPAAADRADNVADAEPVVAVPANTPAVDPALFRAALVNDATPKIGLAERKYLFARASEFGFNEKRLREAVKAITGSESTADLTKLGVDTVVLYMDALAASEREGA